MRKPHGMSEFGRFLKNYIMDRGGITGGCTQELIAKQVLVDSGYLSNLVTGKRTFSQKVKNKIMKRLDMTEQERSRLHDIKATYPYKPIEFDLEKMSYQDAKIVAALEKALPRMNEFSKRSILHTLERIGE